MSVWLVMALIGLLTFGMRLSFILLFTRLASPGWVFRALRFVPPAVLTAIIVPELFLQQGKLALNPWNARLVAGGLAALVAWRTKNAVLTVIAGMAALYGLRALGW